MRSGTGRWVAALAACLLLCAQGVIGAEATIRETAAVEGSSRACLPLYPWWLSGEWPEYVINGEPTVVVSVWLTNLCDYPLEVTEIQLTEESGSGWLGSSVPSFTIPSESSAGFDVLITPPAAGSGMQFLSGAVKLVFSPDSGEVPTQFPVRLTAGDDLAPARYDTVATSNAWGGKGGKGIGDNVALTVSNFGEVGAGNSDLGGVGLDFVVDGNDCDTTKSHYLYGGSPFYMENTGSGVSLTTSHYAGTSGPYEGAEAWKPVDEAMSGGTGGNTAISYDSVYTGKCVNWDATVAMERTFYAPRDNPSNPSFVVCKTMLYSEDGQAHNHIAFGSATDWDVPADRGSENTSGVTPPTSPGGVFVYQQGTDTAGSDACQSNLRRFATEVSLGWYAASELHADSCATHHAVHGMWAVDVRDFFDYGVEDDEPDAQMWWDSIGSHVGFVADSVSKDQGCFLTFIHDYNLPAFDTLVFWTVFATMRSGTLTQFEANVSDAADWYSDRLRPCNPGCCMTLGNVDQSSDHQVTMGDLTVLIDHLFISMNPLPCAEEGNVDLSPDGLITMGDLTVLIDHLFISFNPLPSCDDLP